MPLAKALAALDVLSGGRLVAGVGTGSSERDYAAVGVPFHDRWQRFDEAVRILRELLGQERAPQGTRYFIAPDLALAPHRGKAAVCRCGSEAGDQRRGCAV